MSYPYESQRVTAEVAAAAVNDLKQVIAIPSLSTDVKYKKYCERMALWLQDFLSKIEFEVKVFETPMMPIVYAEKIFDPDLPTILIYGHYDVMPASEPGWESDPFEMLIKDGKLFGRGTSDDKGQVLIQLYALRLLHQEGFKGVNFKLILEGEEESGSENLEPFIHHNLDKLKSDVVVVSDTTLATEDIPGVTSSVRGSILCEVALKVSKQDMHSGVFGGMVVNPANLMANLIAEVKSFDGRIQIPGFYDGVKEYSAEFRKDLEKVDKLCFSKEVMDNFEILKNPQESGYTAFEGATIRPSFDINGMVSGFIEEGAKTIVPSSANAKFSFRLVANQDPAKIMRDFKIFIKSKVPHGVELVLTEHGEYLPYATDEDSPYLNSALEVLEDIFVNKAYLVPCGGSIPIGALFKEALQIETIFLGFGLETDNIHGPNEHISIKNFLRGMDVLCEYYKKIASI